jgi:excisionase family DNA binding protein
MAERERTELLSIGEAAARLGVSVATLRAWVKKGWINAVIYPSGFRRFTEEEIERRRREMGIDT